MLRHLVTDGPITLANGAVLNVSSTGDVTLTQNHAYEGLRDGDSADVIFSYTMEDAAHAQSTTGATITVSGSNDTPTLDLDNSVPANGNNFSTTEITGDSVAIANTPAITDGLNNAEGQIKSISFALTAVSGGTNSGEGLTLPASMVSNLHDLGIAEVTGNGTDSVTITADTFFTPTTGTSKRIS